MHKIEPGFQRERTPNLSIIVGLGRRKSSPGVDIFSMRMTQNQKKILDYECME